MEHLVSNKFKVKSLVCDYSVFFTDNSAEILSKIYNKGDFIIIDKFVFKNYKELISEKFDASKIIKIDASEKTKSYQGVEPILDNLIHAGFKKNHRLIAIGGGITQDVVAFMASILYRGVKWIFFPTTLLAQGDSCIGSKTSINFNKFKNQVGGFYPPIEIYIDANFLKTLSYKELQSGFGEMAHYFVVSGKKDFDFYKKNYPLALKDLKVISSLTNRSLQIKKSYVEIDEFDQNERQVFNYGHSFGHAIESIYNYSIPHGIAVSFGMDIANYVSMKKGYINIDDFNYMRQLFKQIWSGYSISELDLDLFLDALKKDKKNVDNMLGLILNKGVGKVFKDFTNPDKTFINWLDEYLNKYQKKI